MKTQYTNVMKSTAVLLVILSAVPAYSQSNDQSQAENECNSGSVNACRELAVWAHNLCRRGHNQACDYSNRAVNQMHRNQEGIRRGYPDQVYDESGLELAPNTNDTIGIINGTGRGGAGYTNDAARAIMDGTLDPAEAARRSMGGR